MKPLIIAFCLLVLATLSVQSTLACSCVELKNTTFVSVGPAQTADEIKKWRAEQTDSALFNGRVVRIDTIYIRRSVNRSTPTNT